MVSAYYFSSSSPLNSATGRTSFVASVNPSTRASALKEAVWSEGSHNRQQGSKTSQPQDQLFLLQKIRRTLKHFGIDLPLSSFEVGARNPLKKRQKQEHPTARHLAHLYVDVEHAGRVHTKREHQTLASRELRLAISTPP